MPQSELQKNVKRNLLQTLHNMASLERQLEYKRSVPFVHVPDELLEQWDEYSRLLGEKRKWFVEIFTPDELLALHAFDRAINDFDDNIPDVPKVFQHEKWLALVERSKKLLASL